jgi:hypothetical protein
MSENVYDNVVDDSTSRHLVAENPTSENGLVYIDLVGESSQRLENRKSVISNKFFMSKWSYRYYIYLTNKELLV